MIGRTRRVAGTDAALLLAIAVVAVSVALAALAAPSADLDDRARAIEAQLRCPTCQGLSIADSPATSATQMRALVREQLAGGASDDQVRAFFVSRYGRWILLDPPLGGPDLALWLAPVVIVAAGVALVVRRARSLDRRRLLRGWTALPVEPASPLSTVLIGGAMVLALAVPIAVVVGPRRPPRRSRSSRPSSARSRATSRRSSRSATRSSRPTAPAMRRIGTRPRFNSIRRTSRRSWESAPSSSRLTARMRRVRYSTGF